MSFKTKKIPEHLIIRPPTWDRPKKKGRWVLWLIGPLLCFGLIIFALDSKANELKRPGSGQLHFNNKANGKTSALHIKSSVDIEVSGIVAKIKLIQTFSNHTDFWQEGIYVFPLPENAAVNFMQMTIGDRNIKALIKKKDDAKKIYKNAKTNGQYAALIEQSRPNLFIQKISNIAPGETVTVEIHLIQRVEYESGSFALRFPTTYTPRYHPVLRQKLGRNKENEYEDEHNLENKQPLGGNRDNEKLTTLIEATDSAWRFINKSQAIIRERETDFQTSKPSLNPIEISVNLNVGLSVSQITSPFHEIDIIRQGLHHKISLKNVTTSMDRDFILEWQPTENSSPQAAIFRERLGNKDYVLLMILPPSLQTEQNQLPKEMIFIIDTSGSMGGESIRQAKSSLEKAIQSLRPLDRFNIIEFNSLYSRLFYESQDANSQNKRLAQHWVNRLTAGGGTEMLPALRAALRSSNSTDRLKQIVFITDGAVSNEADLFSLIHEKLDGAMLFTVGIGSAPNSYFMRKAAQFGRGTFTHIGDASEVHSKMGKLFEKLENPIVKDISITWPESTETYPKHLPSLYLNEPLFVVARTVVKTSNLTSNVIVQGTTSSQNWVQKLELNTKAFQSGIGTLWARAKIESLEDEIIAGSSANEIKDEITEIALQHQLVSEFTSLVAVEDIISRPPNAKLKQSQILNLAPKGKNPLKLNYPKTATTGEISFWVGCMALLFGFVFLSRRNQNII